MTDIEHTDGRGLLAYRGEFRWAPSLQPARVAAPAPDASRLRDRGVYLITGGLGSAGLTIAEALARDRHARLALMSRSAPPARNEPDRAGPTASAETLDRLSRIEASGGEVLHVTADVSDPAQVRDAIGQVRARFGRINGVIHTAGVAGGGLLLRHTSNTIDSVLKPKAGGLLALRAAIVDEPLDFLLLFSSVSSVLGEYGQSAYCAANAFLDAYAAASRPPGPHVISVNWDTWKEGGMTVRSMADPETPSAVRSLLRAELEHGLTADEAVDVFYRALSIDVPQILVSTRDAAAVERHTKALVERYLNEARAGSATQGTSSAREERYVAPRNELEEAISRIWRDVTGIQRIGVEDNFFDLGGHSLLAATVVARIREECHVEIPLQQFFDTPTVAGICEFLGEPRTDPRVGILQMLSDLSDEEVERELARRTAG